MKSSTWLFAAASALLVALALPPATVKARDADNKPLTLATAHSSKQQRMNICRARYRDCLSLKQIPAFECRFVYEDCIRSMI